MDVSGWSGSAAKLFLVLLFADGRGLAWRELMAGMGTCDNATFYAARRALVEAGVAEVRMGKTYLVSGKPTGGTPHVVANPTRETPPVASGDDHTGEKLEVTSEMRRSWREAAERLRAKGLGHLTGGTQ